MATKPQAPHFSASKTIQLYNVGDGGEWKKGQNNRSPHPCWFGRALPHPHSWGGGKAWERATGASLERGGVVVPGGRKRRKKLLPLWSTPPTPAPTSGPRGPANRMEVGAGRTGSERRHWPGLSRAGWGRELCSKTDPLSLGENPWARRQENPQRNLP